MTTKVLNEPKELGFYSCYKEQEEMGRNDASKKCIVLLSGGIDSTVLMYSLIADYEVYPLTIGYGQRHKKEVIAARNVCEARGQWLLKRWKYVDLSNLRSILPSALTGVGEVPEGHYTSENMVQTVVPFRNGVLLSLATGYAESLSADCVAYAAHGGDHAIYPDCRPEFVDCIRKTIKLGTDGRVGLVEPFTYKTKADIIRLGKKLVVPLRLCWTCYVGDDRPCLRCGTCVERTLAFHEVGFPDPVLSSEEWSEALKYALGVSK